MSTYKRATLMEFDATDVPNHPVPLGGSPPPHLADHDRVSILLVDDEPRNLTVLESVLDDQGYRLVRAESAERALLALVAEEFALLVVDIQMPGMNGFDLAQMIKQRQKTAGVPIIFLTAYYSEDRHVLEGYNAGAVDYLHKPINPTILRSKVAVFAELYRKTRQSVRDNRTLLNEIAARRRAEEQLRRLNEELELRVASRTAELVQANTALSEKEREMRSLADNTPDILTRFDRQLRYVFVNSAIQRPTGRGRDEFIGRSMRDLELPEDLCCIWEEALTSVFDTQEQKLIEYSYSGPDGERLYATRLVPERGPSCEVEYVLGITQDVTERKRAEEALKRVDRRKDEFLATLAHELRNPLAPIRNSIEILRLAPANPSVVQSAQETMSRQIQHMIRLIEDLLDVTRITSQKVTLRKTRVSFREVIETAVEASRPIIEAKKHCLRLVMPEEPIWLNADSTRLTQVITNLLTNAAKYTADPGSIELVGRRQGGEIVVQVTDTGMGLPHEMLEEVFEMFTQVNRALDRSQGGLGLGLALARQMVQLHGGTISAESPGLGQGSTFTIRLPIILTDSDRTTLVSTGRE
jgi:PAS domain S-box-containing protein